MTMFRFVTPNRIGKWYADLQTAQRRACAIGAGFFDERSLSFYPYRDTRLEMTGGAETANDRGYPETHRAGTA